MDRITECHLRCMLRLTAGLSAGGALYCTVVDNNARQALEPGVRVKVWRQMFPRALRYMGAIHVPLAVLTGANYLKTKDTYWLIALAPLAFNIAFTAIAIMPTNNALLDKDLDIESSKAVELHNKWCWQTNVRTVGFMAIFIMALSKGVEICDKCF